MRLFLVFLALSVGLKSYAYNSDRIIDQNPRLLQAFEIFSKHKALRTTKVAVVGDYVHTDVFADILALNSEEIPQNGRDDDGNGYVDDYLGVDITTKSGVLTAPKLSGHENGIVSLLDALIKELHLEDAISIIPISIELSKRSFDELTMKKLADAIDYARNRGAKIISLSLGVSKQYKSFFEFIDRDYDKSFTYLEKAIQRAHEAGIILLGANSNDSHRNHDSEPQIPANLEHVISVANVDYSGEIISGFGDSTDVAFYGTDIYVWEGKEFGYALQRGSSYATPLVALSLALSHSLSEHGISPSQQLNARLKSSCEFSIKTQRNVSSRCVFSPSAFFEKTP